MWLHLTKGRDKTNRINSRTNNNNNNSNIQNQDLAGQQQHLHLNWSNFKPEFSGKSDEDAEAHLLHSNDWMNAHALCQWCKSPEILSYIVTRRNIMVSISRTYKCRLARIAKLYLDRDIQR